MPYYAIPFDRKGRCEGPETRTHLINAVNRGTFTDIYLFSHGWNNDWTVATQRYESFIAGFMTMRRTHALTFTQPYRPLLVGIFWPSTALVFGEGEAGPEIAAGDPGAIDVAVAAERQAVGDVAEQLADVDVEIGPRVGAEGWAYSGRSPRIGRHRQTADAEAPTVKAPTSGRPQPRDRRGRRAVHGATRRSHIDRRRRR